MRRPAVHPSRICDFRDGAFAFHLGLPAVFLALSGMVFDDGISAVVCCIGALAYWAMVGIIAARRSNRLTRTDVGLIRVGFFIWTAAAILLFLAWLWYLSHP